MPILFSLFFYSSWSTARELWLGVGEVRALPAPPGASVKVGGRGILRVVDGERAIRVIALKPGRATVVVGATVLDVRVTPAQQLSFVRELRSTVAAMRGLTLDLGDGRPEIGGTLLRFSDWRVIAEVARRHRGEYGFRARALRDVGDEAIRYFNDLARARGYPIVRFSTTPDFTAVVPSAAPELRAPIERGLKPFGIGVESAPDALRLQPLIRTRVVLAEVSRGFSRSFGLQWPSEYAAQILPRAHAETDVLAALRALESKGQAQVLASPDLSCRSGGEARVLAGGELPIRTATRQRQGVEWKSFGVTLNVRPRADYHGNISIDLKTEISLVDFAHAVDGVPALKKNVVESQFDLPGKRTVALSGLIRRESGRSDEGLPFLSQIPVLGRLFASRQYQRHQSELLVFVTPEIDEPGVDATPTMPEGWIRDE